MVLPTFKTAKVKSRSTFARMLSVEENYEIFKKADLGDFLGVEGEVMRTDMGELSIKATHITHLSKALRPLPEKSTVDRR